MKKIYFTITLLMLILLSTVFVSAEVNEPNEVFLGNIIGNSIQYTL